MKSRLYPVPPHYGDMLRGLREIAKLSTRDVAKGAAVLEGMVVAFERERAKPTDEQFTRIWTFITTYEPPRATREADAS